MILRTIKCDKKKCIESFTEEFPNQGFPGWGHIAGLHDDKTGNETAYLCPEHLQEIAKFLNEE